MYRSITMPEFYQASKQQKFHLIDVREVDEFISGHVPNAQNNPVISLHYCQFGERP